MRTLIVALFLFLCMTGSRAAQAGDAAATLMQASDNYVQCNKLLDQSAEKALAFAAEWVSSENPPSYAALHCKALALLAVDAYSEAASILETLSQSTPPDRTDLWGKITMQLGYAQRRAGNFDAAARTFSSGVDMLGNQPLDMMQVRMLVERGKTYLFSHNTGLAMDDFVRAVSLNGWDVQSLWMRGRAFASFYAPQLAQGDIQQMLQLQLNPNSIRMNAEKMTNEIKSISTSIGR